MPQYTLAFFVENARDLEPPLQFAGVSLETVGLGEEARERLQRELDPIRLESLEINGQIPVVTVNIEASDEEHAISLAYDHALTVIEPYSLLEPEAQGITIGVRKRPLILPNALFIDSERDPGVVDFRYYHSSALGRITVGEKTLSNVRTFNNDVVRRIASLYPASLIKTELKPSSLELRIARAVHWYSQGEGQRETTLAFICYWIGLEALVLKSSTSNYKRRSIVGRIGSLALIHNPNSDWDDGIGSLWDKRSDIVHEGFGAASASSIPDIVAGDINSVKYLFIVTLLYVLDQRQNGKTLDDLWHPKSMSSYIPSVKCTATDMPIVYQIARLKRGWVEHP